MKTEHPYQYFHSGTYFQAMFCLVLIPTPYCDAKHIYMIEFVREHNLGPYWVAVLSALSVFLLCGAMFRSVNCRHIGLTGAAFFWASLFFSYVEKVGYAPVTGLLGVMTVMAIWTFKMDVWRKPRQQCKEKQKCSQAL